MTQEYEDQMRADFEGQFTPPDDCSYNPVLDQYSWLSHLRAAHPFNDLWEAWQAAHARYAGGWEAVGEVLVDDSYLGNGERHARIFDESLSHGTKLYTHQATATPSTQAQVPDRASVQKAIEIFRKEYIGQNSEALWESCWNQAALASLENKK